MVFVVQNECTAEFCSTLPGVEAHLCSMVNLICALCAPSVLFMRRRKTANVALVTSYGTRSRATGKSIDLK